MRRSLILVAALAAFGLLAPAAAETYQWTDKDGTVHFTDDPNQLPEPQRTRVLQRLEAERQKAKAPGAGVGRYDPIPPEARAERLPEAPGEVPPPPPAADPVPPPPEPTAAPAQDKAYWQGKLAAARKRVADLERRCAELAQRQQTSNTQYLMFGQAAAQTDAAEALKLQQKCEAELEEARGYLRDGLPEEARKAGALPGWIR